MAGIALVVLGTTVFVTAVGRLAAPGPGSLAWTGLAALVAAAVAAVAWHVSVVQPQRAQIQSLTDRLRRWGDGADAGSTDEVDPELVALDSAVTEAVFEVKSRVTRLQERVDVLAEAMQASSFGIALISADGVITDVNDEFRGMFRLRGEPVGRRPLEAVPSVDIHLVIEQALTRGAAERVFVTGSSDLVARAEALHAGVLLQVEDITGRREAERARTDFVANVSHELRTPLSAILGYLETMLHDEERIPDDLLKHLKTVDRNTRRLRDLFEDLLRLHRIEARRRELPMEHQPLRPILVEAVGPAADRAAMRGQTFTLECPDEIHAVVNPDALTAIVGNLAGNASAYTPEGGSVSVRAEQADSGVVQIDVVDDGIGIARQHHERIFERFYRIDTARSRREGGTGLGLAIVKHYALACGFHLELQSEEGQGTTFSVVLASPAAPR
ncbi:MAG: hypothetical protein KTR31_12955 [Myxococcales bacterium]|nr:hypothetical protein [Myxococcales bacterium]